MYNKHSSGFAVCRVYSKGVYPEKGDLRMGLGVWELSLMWSQNFAEQTRKEVEPVLHQRNLQINFNEIYKHRK